MKSFLSAVFTAGVLIASALPLAAARLPADSTQADTFFIHRVDALYPPSARDQNIEGDVTILVSVAKNGHVQSAQIARSSGHSILDDSALRAAVESTYVQAGTHMTYSVRYSFRASVFQRHAGQMRMR